ncbi:MAG: hypothetical protein V4590_06625 [Bacteroidota bacterium]
MNDTNSTYADSYHLIQLKGGRKLILFHSAIELFAGCDNLLNRLYSLGNDLNTAGGRYYNAALLRNYFVGLSAAF